jgi:Fe/S biogenesis protein NfuA
VVAVSQTDAAVPASPFAAGPGAAEADDLVINVTEVARAKLIELRDEEPEGDRLGVRIEIVSDEGQDFMYDLSFQIITKADLSDLVRNHGGLRVIVPAGDAQNLEGATLDFEAGGLVLRNPNRPKPVQLGALIIDDEVAGQIRLIIDDEINPALDSHGGFVTLVGHDGEGRAYLTMGGGCHGCAMSRMTMLQGVQATIKERVPSIAKVIDATDHSTGENPFYS